MPGILPMKVIKVGSSSQSRIAQACDRCRSKKIRCDGIRPCCTQCANVGFECRTSDKLSRRAFPRGYTESLEERVRQLEAEVRELKDLLDEKDEKIDMLAKMHSNRRHSSLASHIPSPSASTGSPRASPTPAAATSSSTSSAFSAASVALKKEASDAVSTGLSAAAEAASGSESAPASEAVASIASTSPSAPPSTSSADPELQSVAPLKDSFRVQASPLLLGVENSDSYFMGASSGRAFIETLKRKMQESGKSCADFHADAFLHIQGCYSLVDKPPAQAIRVPPRLFSDRCVNVFFQEWSPLFPVLHRPAFLHIYDEFVSDPDKVKSHHKLAQLHLVFAIAALSSDQPDLEQISACELQWQRSLDAVLMDNTVLTLQCLVLALLYCTVRADYKRLQYYKGIAIGLSHRLGLHQSQKRFSFGALTIETRKKIFWTLYTLDCFSAATLGLPKLIKEDDVHTEYPADTDDEYVTEKGFQPTLPGESTRLSAALALFRAARVLAKVLETIYPAASTYELSLQKMALLETELVEWRDALPPHLTLTFRQEKPSTDVTGSRSPLLSLAFYYIRTLIWRPAIGSSLGAKAGPALMTVSEAAKHIIQIIELLQERKMSLSLCMNKADLVVVCGMSLLYQSMDLKRESMMLKDSERLINSVIRLANGSKAPGCYDLKRVANMLVTLDDTSALLLAQCQSSPDLAMNAPTRRTSSFHLHQQHQQQQQHGSGRHNSASMSESDLRLQQEKLRRMTLPAIAPSGVATKTDQHSGRSRSSFDTPRDQAQHRLSLSQIQLLTHSPQSQKLIQKKKNLDYLCMESGVTAPSQPTSPILPRLSQQQQQQQQLYSRTERNQKASLPANVSPSDWEALLGSVDGGQMNIYDAIYGGPALALSTATEARPASTTSQSGQSGDGWSPESWDLTGFTLADLPVSNNANGAHGDRPVAQSVLSFSDESLSSGGAEELPTPDLARLGLGNLGMNSLGNNSCGQPMDGYVMEGMENSFVL